MLLLSMMWIYGKAQSPAEQHNRERSARLKSLIDSRQYRFVAHSAATHVGKVDLGPGSELKLMKDNLHVDLPYYGRANSSYFQDPTDMSVRINTNNFSYTADSAKKGGWDITLRPKKDGIVYNIVLSVSTDGYCKVKITSSIQDPITYYGILSDLNPQFIQVSPAEVSPAPK